MIRGHSTDSDSSFTLSPKRVCNERGAIAEEKTMDTLDTAQEMRELKTLMLQVKSSQDSLKASLESRFDSFQKQLSSQIESVKETMYIELGRLENRISQMEGKLNALQSKVEANNVYSTDTTVILINLKEDANEDITKKCNELLSVGLGIRDIYPVRSQRLTGRDGRPGIVKLQLSSKEEKIRVLQQKFELQNTPKFKKVYLRSAQTHEERLIRLNFQTLLEELPGGDNYRFTGSGRLVRKVEHDAGVDGVAGVDGSQRPYQPPRQQQQQRPYQRPQQPYRPPPQPRRQQQPRQPQRQQLPPQQPQQLPPQQPQQPQQLQQPQPPQLYQPQQLQQPPPPQQPPPLQQPQQPQQQQEDRD